MTLWSYLDYIHRDDYVISGDLIINPSLSPIVHPVHYSSICRIPYPLRNDPVLLISCQEKEAVLPEEEDAVLT
jgi:hypothetical protein